MAATESGYTQEQIEDWGQKLTEFAKKPKLVYSRKETVEALIEPITEALRTHSYREVAEILKEWGFEISEGSLKQYVSRSVKSKSASSKSTARASSKNSSKTRDKEVNSSVQLNGSSSDSKKDDFVNHSVTEASAEVAPMPRSGRKIETAY